MQIPKIMNYNAKGSPLVLFLSLSNHDLCINKMVKGGCSLSILLPVPFQINSKVNIVKTIRKRGITVQYLSRNKLYFLA